MLAACSAGAAQRHIDLISETPCLEAYRLWHFSNRRSSTFKAPPEFTQEQCDKAAGLHLEIQAELAAEQEAARTVAEKEAVADQARVEAARRAEMEAAIRQAMRPAAKIGMDKDNVINRTYWGKPQEINTTTTGAGTTEQWVYGLGRYLYFTNGKLTAIQDRRQ